MTRDPLLARESTVIVSTVIPRQMRSELERIAANEDRTLSYVIRRGLTYYLAADPSPEDNHR